MKNRNNELERPLTFLERKACLMLGNLRHDGNDFYACWQNDLVLLAAKVLLCGRDPIRFAKDLLKRDPDNVDQWDEIEYQFDKMRH